MEKSSSNLLVSLMIPLLAASVISCAGAESPGTGSGTGGKSGGTGGNSTGSSTGGRAATGSGGSSVSSSGGSSVSSSGGSTGFGSGGATGFGSGGATGFGSGGSIISGGSTGGAPVTGGGAVAITDGYGMSGTWMGYGYTFVGPMVGSKAMVMPTSFMAMTSFCATGTIAVDATYNSVAGLGWNINQARGTTATPPPILPTATAGTGLTVNVSATGLTLAAGTSSQLRAQIKTASGDFCAPIGAAGSNNIPWGSFNKTCWDTTLPAAMAFAGGGQITAVELVIPSGLAAVGPFNLCLLDAHTY